MALGFRSTAHLWGGGWEGAWWVGGSFGGFGEKAVLGGRFGGTGWQVLGGGAGWGGLGPGLGRRVCERAADGTLFPPTTPPLSPPNPTPPPGRDAHARRPRARPLQRGARRGAVGPLLQERQPPRAAENVEHEEGLKGGCFEGVLGVFGFAFVSGRCFMGCLFWGGCLGLGSRLIAEA